MADRSIPTFQSTIEEAIWAQVYVRHLLGLDGSASTAWRQADAALEDLRDEAQRREMEAACPR